MIATQETPTEARNAIHPGVVKECGSSGVNEEGGGGRRDGGVW